MYISLSSISLPMRQVRSCYYSNQVDLGHWAMEQRDLDVEVVLTAYGYHIYCPIGTLHMHALIFTLPYDQVAG